MSAKVQEGNRPIRASNNRLLARATAACRAAAVRQRSLRKYFQQSPKQAFVLFLFTTFTLGVDRANISGVEGLVTLNGQTPLANAKIGLENEARGTHLQRQTDASGYYLFEGVLPGPYTIWAEASGYGCILIPHLIVERGRQVRQDFTFVRGTVKRECEPLKQSAPKQGTYRSE